MRYLLLLLLFVSLFTSSGQVNKKEVYVKPYVKSNGTVVQGYYRTAPNSTNRDNFSTKGNTNPHTGKPGYITPDNNLNYNYNITPSYNNNSYSNYNFSNSDTKSKSNNYEYNTSYNYEEPSYYTSPPKPINLGVNDLINFTQKQNWDDINDALSVKGWTYHNSETGDALNSITWAFDKDYSTNKARGWLYVDTYNEVPVKTTFNFFNKATYTNIKNSLTQKGFKLIETKIENDYINATYSDSKFTLKLITSNSKSDESIVSYVVSIIKKGSYFDQENGPKEEFDEAGNLKWKINLKDGKLSGPVKAYYENGVVHWEGTYFNNLLNGKKKIYDEFGNITEESTFVDGELNGPFVIYNSGNIYKRGTIKNGYNEGVFTEFNEFGEIAKEYNYKNGLLNGKYTEYYYSVEGSLLGKYSGNYSNDLKSGLWKNNYGISKDEKTVEFWNYSEGELNGSFKEIKEDSILIGNYKNGLYNDKLIIYSSKVNSILGRSVIDSTLWILIGSGEFNNGEMNGNWKYYYDYSGRIESEGNYLNGKKNGEWNYYMDNLVDRKGILYPVSNKLFLKETYKNGKKNGREERYLSFRMITMPCYNEDLEINNDTCYSYKCNFFTEFTDYKNDILDGEYIYKDSSGMILFKGNYIRGEKDGVWFETRKIELDSNKYANKSQEGKYKNGKRDGEWKTYFNKNCINETFNFEYGVLNGRCSEYTCPEKKLRDIYYDNDVFVQLDVFDSLGLNVQTEYEISDIKPNSYKCNYTTYHKNGSISQVYTILKNEDEEIESGLFEFVFLSKAIWDESQTQAYADGKNKIVDDKGRVLVEGNILKSSKIGFWNFYDYSANVLIVVEYSDNKIVRENYVTIENRQPFTGKYTVYNSNGIISYNIEIENGLKDGKSKIYTEEGKLHMIKKYKKGELIKTKMKN